MKRYIHEARQNLSALPTWLKLMLTTVLIAHGVALGLLYVTMTFEADQLLAIGTILTKFRAHGKEVMDYFHVNLTRSFYVYGLFLTHFGGNAIGFLLLGWMWFPMRKKVVDGKATASLA